MMKFKCLYCITLLVFVDLTVSLIPNVTEIQNINNNLRRSVKRHKKERSTSSSEQGKESRSSLGDKESLDLSTHEISSKESDSKPYKKIQSSLERRGWRKWHRKCRVCKEDMLLKWRDPRIKWICGGYQRARRSFKSECMMHYRNCQDGTIYYLSGASGNKLLITKNLVFVKVHDHRCTTETGKDQPEGINFFYEYKVAMSGDSTDSRSDDESTVVSSDF